MRRFLAVFLAILIVLLLTAGGVLVWLGGTPDGTRRIFALVSEHTPLKIEAKGVEGRLLGDLRLSGVRVKLPLKEIELEKVHLRWRPLLLLAGGVAVEEAVLQGVRIQDNAPVVKKAPDLRWPLTSAIPGWLEGTVDHVLVERLSYRHLAGEAMTAERISLSLSWHDRTLTLANVRFVSPAGTVAGGGMAAFRRPALRFDLVVTPATPVKEITSFSLRGRYLSPRAGEQLAVEIAVVGRGGRRTELEAAGELGMTRDTFNIRALTVSSPRRRGKLSGSGSVRLTADEPVFAFDLGAAGVDLAPEVKRRTDLTGKLRLEGTRKRYEGRLALANRGEGWQSGRIAASFAGDEAAIDLAPFDLFGLDGVAHGTLRLGWRGGITVEGRVQARNLNPARLSPEWVGVLNADLDGTLAWRETEHRGEVHGRILDSRLRGQPLRGTIAVSLEKENLLIEDLLLQGNGFKLAAAGELKKRITFAAEISDLAGLVPQARGELATEGWLSWREGRGSGEVSGSGKRLAAAGIGVDAVTFAGTVGEGESAPVEAQAALQGVVYNRFKSDAVTVKVSGTLPRHTVHATAAADGAAVDLLFSGGVREKRWAGELTGFSGHDRVGPWRLAAPAALGISASGVSVAPLVIDGAPGEQLAVGGTLAKRPFDGTVSADWVGLNLARANQWLSGMTVSGGSSGTLRLSLLPDERVEVKGELAVAATVASGGRQVNVKNGAFRIDGGARGITAAFQVDLAEGGGVEGSVSSPAPARLALPETGDISAEWTGFDLVFLRPWLPAGVALEGKVGGRVAGRFLPDNRFDLKGTTAVSEGVARFARSEGELKVAIRTFDMSWGWRGETLAGELRLSLAEYGQVKGNLTLPLPARFPAAFTPEGPVAVALEGEVLELGILTAFFPGMMQESHGLLRADVKVGGTWAEPQVAGTVQLAKAGAYLPSAGVTLKDLQFVARLDRDRIGIESFRVGSGPGYLEGKGVLRLEGWRLAGYEGSLDGDRFRFVFLPEFQAVATPHLTFSGTPEKVTVRGEVRLPELHVYSPATHAPIEASKDVIIEGAPPAAAPAQRLALDVQVGIFLGDRVLVKAKGIDAQLGGQMVLSVARFDEIVSRGEIRVVKGKFKAYGLDLDIVRGRLFYAGGPVDQPTLDILALRTVNDVKAGVTVGGTLKVPVVKLYSEPSMPDVDILAYVVLGHPLGASGEQANLLSQAAGFLLSSGQSVVFQDQLKNRLGLSTLEIGSQTKSTGYMGGYKPVQVGPPGAAPNQTPAGGDLSQTMLTVGKFLTPELYISYGRSLFTGGNLFRLRYDISRRWQIETETGTESGADVYYKIEFN